MPLGRARQLASGIDSIRFVDDDCREIEAGDAGYDVARYKNIAAYTAIAVGAEVDLDSGAVRVVRAVAANDSSQIINPDRVRNQVEGGVVQSTSWTVKEAVLFDRTRILSEDWATYPIPRFPEVPEIEVELIDRPGEPYLGTGETAQGPTARAIANAVFGAAGARARDPADAGAGQGGDVLMSAARRPAATAGSARLRTVADRSAPHPNACRATRTSRRNAEPCGGRGAVEYSAGGGSR